MTPYYQDDFVTLYNCDCREIVPTLGRFDLLLTDPPYGINADKKRADTGRNKHIRQRDYGETNWDEKPIEWTLIRGFIDLAAKSCVWGGNYYPVPPSSSWLVWDKETGENLYADCELAWTNYGGAVRIKHHKWHGFLRKNNERRDHPTQKPLALMTWCIQLAGDDVKIILDPFAGSGTTGRAAKDLQRKCVLIEREERYCEIAAKRMLQEVFDFGASCGTVGGDGNSSDAPRATLF